MTTQTEREAMTVTNMIGKTVTVRRKGANTWLVTQRKVGGNSPTHYGLGGRDYDYAQAPTWLRIDNSGRKKDISINLKWVDFAWMQERRFGYLRHGRSYQVFPAKYTPTTTQFRFAAPAGTSYFGPAPWYSNEDADPFLARICRASSRCGVRTIGKTKQGRPIQCLTIQSGGGRTRKKNVLIHAREHSGESSGSFAVEGLVKHILGKALPARLLRDYAYHIVPVANPEGLATGTKLPNPASRRLSTSGSTTWCPTMPRAKPTGNTCCRYGPKSSSVIIPICLEYRKS